MTTRKSINFTIVPDEPEGREKAERLYANFCAVSHTPFDFTLTFCEVHPLSEKDIADAPEGSTKTFGAPVKAKLVIPVQLVGALAAAALLRAPKAASRESATEADEDLPLAA